MEKATEILPLRLDGHSARTASDGSIAFVANTPELARQFVTAVNSFEAMKEALERCAAADHEPDCQCVLVAGDSCDCCVGQAFAALSRTALAQETDG